jgi:hypothetical protein
MILNLLKISDNTNLLARWQSWSIASDLKSDESLRVPWVRIPLSPKINELYIYIL